MAIRYRVYTEHKNKRDLMAYLNSTLESYTIYYVDGYWRGNAEGSLVIEYISDTLSVVSRGKIFDTAHWIKKYNEQQSVLITQEEVTAVFV